MDNFAVCEISGKQYKVLPNQPLKVDFLGDPSVDSGFNKKIEAEVLLLLENGKFSIGKPFLKEKVTLDFVESIKSDKIRVSKFHPKANFRKTTGHRAKKTKVVWSVKKA